MKKILFILVFASTIAFLPLGVKAVSENASSNSAKAQSTPTTTTTTTTKTTTDTETVPAAPAVVKGNLANLIARADREIARRIAAYNIVVKKIDGLKKLTDAQKTTMKTAIQTDITALNALKTKIDAETTLAAVKTDLSTLNNNYKIFALYNPKIKLLAAANTMNAILDKFTALATKLDTRIKALPVGTDATAMNAALVDMNTQIAAAKVSVTAAIDELILLEPSGYPANKAQLQDAKTKLQAARTALMAAKKDATTIIQALKAAGTNTSDTNTNVSPTNDNTTNSNSGTNTDTNTTTTPTTTGTE